MTVKNVLLDDISIRTELRPGDIGYVIYLHGALYGAEYGYGIQFENYVAKGLCEFYEKYDPVRNRVWICEHNNRIIGFLLLMDRGQVAQLRYFLIEPEYRGIGPFFLDSVIRFILIWTEFHYYPPLNQSSFEGLLYLLIQVLS